MIEPEMAFADIDDAMDNAEQLLKATVGAARDTPASKPSVSQTRGTHASDARGGERERERERERTYISQKNDALTTPRGGLAFSPVCIKRASFENQNAVSLRERERERERERGS